MAEQGDQGQGDSGQGSGQGQQAPPPAGGQGSAGDSGRKFSQEDLDKVAGDARQSGRKTREKELLEALGVDDLEAAKAALAAAKAAEDAQKSELQKATEERDRLKAEAEAAKAEAHAARLDAALERALRDSGLKPERLGTAMRLADRSSLEVTGSEVKGVTEAVEAIKKESPEWFGSPGSPPDASGGTNGSNGTGGVDYSKATPSELQKRLSQFGVALR